MNTALKSPCSYEMENFLRAIENLRQISHQLAFSDDEETSLPVLIESLEKIIHDYGSIITGIDAVCVETKPCQNKDILCEARKDLRSIMGLITQYANTLPIEVALFQLQQHVSDRPEQGFPFSCRCMA